MVDLGESENAIVEQLDIAWAHLGESSSDYDIPDLIAHADIAADWPGYRAKLTRQILNDNYHPLHVEVVDLPKDRLAVRPLARLNAEHRLIYDAAVFAAASMIETAVPRGVYSSRWWKAKSCLLGPTWSWIRMQRAARFLHAKQPSLLLACTDVTAFYEHVDIEILMNDFSGLDGPAWSIEVLGGFLRAFNGLSNAWGIPQGSDASGLLANLYLLPLDVEIIRRGFRHFRYSDDMYIFGEDWISLRAAILEANKILRYRHLNLAASKTEILAGNQIDRKFEDAEKDVISYGIDKQAPAVTHTELRSFFDKTIERDPVSSRDLKFSLSHLKRLFDDHAVEWLIGNMAEVPHASRQALAYLNMFGWLNPKINEAVVDLLTNSKLVIYPYAEQHLLIYMIRNSVKSKDAINAAWKLLLDRNKESFVREFAARFLGLNASAGAASNLRQLFQQESDSKVRRALLIACYESGQYSDQWIEIVRKTDSDLRLTAEYLKLHPKAIPVPMIAYE